MTKILGVISVLLFSISVAYGENESDRRIEENDEGQAPQELGTPRCLVYTDSNFSGRVFVITQDYVNLHKISSGGWIWNTWGDVISSVKCENGGFLKVYMDDSFRGASTRIYNEVPTLHRPEWGRFGDNISSVEFMR